MDPLPPKVFEHLAEPDRGPALGGQKEFRDRQVAVLAFRHPGLYPLRILARLRIAAHPGVSLSEGRTAPSASRRLPARTRA